MPRKCWHREGLQSNNPWQTLLLIVVCCTTTLRGPTDRHRSPQHMLAWVTLNFHLLLFCSPLMSLSSAGLWPSVTSQHHKPNHSPFLSIPQRKIKRKAVISIVGSYCRVRATTLLRLPPRLLRRRPTIRHPLSQAHAYVSITTSYMIELVGELRPHRLLSSSSSSL